MRVALDLGQHADAAATDEHFRSALIIVVTGGRRRRRVLVGEGEQPHLLGRGEPVVVAVEDHQVGHDVQRRPARGSPASRSAAMMPTSSISAGRGVPDGVGQGPAPDPRHHRARGRAGVSSLESLTPGGRGAAGLVDDDDADASPARRGRRGRPRPSGEHAVAVALQGPLDAQARACAERVGAAISWPCAAGCPPRTRGGAPWRTSRRLDSQLRWSAARRAPTARPTMRSLGDRARRCRCRRGRGSGSRRSRSGGRP